MYLVFNVFYFYSGARRILGWAGPTWPPLCYALVRNLAVINLQKISTQIPRQQDFVENRKHAENYPIEISSCVTPLKIFFMQYFR
jgi:hypothetical protein